MNTTVQEPAQVVIVGRPNVGKSALFNRIAGRRIAIVHPESGVTRDRIRTETVWAGRRFSLVDTGGIGVGRGEKIDDDVQNAVLDQARLAVETAGVILFVVDVAAGLTALDEEVADRLRAAGRPVLLVANKADNESRAALAETEFCRLGFDTPYAVSAAHGLGIAELLDGAVEQLPAEETAAETQPEIKLALLGRPNVGKSSIFNRILNQQRAIVSPVPGTTRDAIDVPFLLGPRDEQRPIVLIDTAGLRRHGKDASAVERLGAFRAEGTVRRCDMAVLVLDATTGVTRQDKRVAGLTREHAKGCVIAVNKWDTVAKDDVRLWRKALARELPFLGYAPMLFVSAHTGQGIGDLLEAVAYVGDQIDARLGTGLLNRVLSEAFAATQPPMRRGRRLKLFYAAQVGTRPVTLRLFCNNPDALAPAYGQFLERRIRAAFGLEGAPLAFQWRRRQPSAQRRAANDEDF